MWKMIYKHSSDLCVYRRYENQDNLVLMEYFLINLLKFTKFQTVRNIFKKKSSG